MIRAPGEQPGTAPDPKRAGRALALSHGRPGRATSLRCESLRSVGRSAAILTGGTFAVQAIGILRELFIAAQVGLSRDLDALLIAMVLPTTLAGVLTSGIVTAMVPAYVEARDKGGRLASRGGCRAPCSPGSGSPASPCRSRSWCSRTRSSRSPGRASTRPATTAPSRYLRRHGARRVPRGGERHPVRAVPGGGPVRGDRDRGVRRDRGRPSSSCCVLWGSLNLMALAVGTVVGQLIGVVILLGRDRAGVGAAPSLTFRDGGPRAGRVPAPRGAAHAELGDPPGERRVRPRDRLAHRPRRRQRAALRRGAGADADQRDQPGLGLRDLSDARPGGAGPGQTASRRRPRDRSGSPSACSSRSRCSRRRSRRSPWPSPTAAGRSAPPTSIGRRGSSPAFAPLIVVLMTSPVLAGAHNARRTGTVLLIGGITNVDHQRDPRRGLRAPGSASPASPWPRPCRRRSSTVFFAWRLAAVDRAFNAPADRPGARRSRSRPPPSRPRSSPAIAWSGVVPRGPRRRARRAGGLFGLVRARRLPPRRAARRASRSRWCSCGRCAASSTGAAARPGGLSERCSCCSGSSATRRWPTRRSPGSRRRPSPPRGTARRRAWPASPAAGWVRSPVRRPRGRSPGPARFFHVDGEVRVVDGAETTGRGLDAAGRAMLERLVDRLGGGSWARLDGSYCLVVRDGRTVHLAMDVVGAHAVYWWLADGVLAFHSHLADLAAARTRARSPRTGARSARSSRAAGTCRRPRRGARSGTSGAGQALAFADGAATTTRPFRDGVRDPADPPLPDDRVDRRRRGPARGRRRALLARRRRAGPPVQRRDGLALPRRGAGPPAGPALRPDDHLGRGADPAGMRRDRGRARRAASSGSTTPGSRSRSGTRPSRSPGPCTSRAARATARSISPTTTASTRSSPASATGRCSAATSASGRATPC